MFREGMVAHDSLSIELLRRELWSETFARHIYLFDEVTSTNDVITRIAAEGGLAGSVVVAEAQTAGRGRRGTPWFSPRGVNLYVSVLLRPELPLRAIPVFSFTTSLAMTEAIWTEGIPAAIKWPNDLLVDRRKVGGTLVECAGTGARPDHVILGVGLNVNVRQAELAAALGPAAAGATSLRQAAGREIDRNKLLATYLNFLEKWLDVYRTRGPDPVLYAWRERDVLTGRRVVVVNGGQRGPEHVLGVNQDGCLVVEDPAGAVREVLSGEVQLAD